MRLPTRPTIYEINTAVWLGDLSRAAGSAVVLSNVPAERVGQAGGVAGRRDLADGRLAAQPGRARDRRAERGAGVELPRDAAGSARRRRDRIPILRPGI